MKTSARPEVFQTGTAKGSRREHRSMNNVKMQVVPEVFHDEKFDWEKYKAQADLTALAFDSFHPQVAERIRICASLLGVQFTEGGSKVVNAWLCKHRLCPTCQKRKSLKLYRQMRKIVAYLTQHGIRRYIFVTLTVRNCSGADLKQTLDQLSEGWNRLQRFPEFNSKLSGTHIRGFYKAVEVTHNIDPTSPSYDTYHPHIHALFAVDEPYFKSRRYCSRKRLQEIWKQAMRLDYDPEVWMRAVREDDPDQAMRAIAELTKYTVKSKDYLVPDDWQLTENTVRILQEALFGRKFLAFGGCFRAARKALELDDIEEGDLLHADDPSSETDDPVIFYTWCTGYNQYRIS